MAHFAELNNSNEVLRVVVISNDDVNANGGDYSSSAETFVSTIVPHASGGNQWKQTSYNGNARKQYAGIGMTYDATKNKFISPQPYSSWSLDDNDDWQAPVPYPKVTEIDSNIVLIFWDEDNQKWTGKVDSTNYDWDATNLQWNEV
jgi:hypothetical protein|tara:strand:- start:473 stop:910 length:438 start_codon:yes stop_codon:yes gene_type:complete